jgi:hypothetical protein
MEILQSGAIESDDQLMELSQRYSQIIIPTENDDLDLTHWWILADDGNQMLYVGAPETFWTW